MNPLGIGTGWSSTIPNYNPQDLIDNLRRMLKDEARRIHVYMIL